MDARGRNENLSSDLWRFGMQCGIALQMHDFHIETLSRKIKGISCVYR